MNEHEVKNVEVARHPKELGEYAIILEYKTGTAITKGLPEGTPKEQVLWVDWRITQATAQHVENLDEVARAAGFNPDGLRALKAIVPLPREKMELGPLLYSRADDDRSLPATDNPLEGEVEASGYIKWDGCNEIYIAGAHLCHGPDELKKLLDACVEACREAAKRLTSRDWEKS